MLKDLRNIWTEDQYRILGPAQGVGNFYFGRKKRDHFQVYVRSVESVQRTLVQTVSLEQDWYWCFESQRLIATRPKKTKVSIRRTEHLLSGYHYSKGFTKKNIEDLSSTVQVVEQKLSTGAQVIWLLPKNPRSWILSLHGGPESSEGYEIRYGGLYRDLLQQNKAIAILNYRGSSNLKPVISKKAWGNWARAISEDFLSLCRNAKEHALEVRPDALFGVSFGAALALLLQKEFSIKKSVLLSPLLDLSEQIQRSPVEYQRWFRLRFSEKDRQSLGYQNLCKNIRGEVCVVYSLQDEVLGVKFFSQLEKDKRQRKKWKLYPQSGPHAPERYIEFKDRFGLALNALK